MSARTLLGEFIRAASFRIKGTQVDGGSEFKVAFEDARWAQGLALDVLPPKCP